MKTLSGISISRQETETKIRRRMLVTGDGCWEWQGARNNAGYGVLVQDRLRFATHRIAYELWVGPIPEGYHIHHRCRNRACLRPEHMEALPASAHVRLPQPHAYIRPAHRARRETLEERFLRSRRITATGCWEREGHIRRDGYRNFKYQGKTQLLHRVVYQYYKGDIPDAYDLDHLCRNPGCFNPDHLEAVSRFVNEMRGKLSALREIKSHCAKGHPFDLLNTYWQPYRRRDGTLLYTRTCRICQAESNRRSRPPAMFPRVIDPKKAQEIRRLRSEGMLLREIGVLFGVSVGHVCTICKGKAWK